MIKLNNKGFTLIELLAVIVILAIIMVVTIPTVLNSMGQARQKTFETSANTVADWVEKEYALAQLGMGSEAFTKLCPEGDSRTIVISGGTGTNYAGNRYCDSSKKGFTTVNMIADSFRLSFSETGSTTIGPPLSCWSNNQPANASDVCESINFSDSTDVNKSKENADNAVAFLKAAGVNPENYSALKVEVTDGRACVKLKVSKSGDFKTVSPITTQSSGC